MPSYNLILNAHAIVLGEEESGPKFVGGNNSPPFNKPIGQNNMSITVPANIELVFYTDIYELTNSCSGKLSLNVKNPGRTCHGQGQHENYPALIFDANLPPKRIISGGGIVPNLALWSDKNGYFYSGMSTCKQKGSILNIDSLSDRWTDGGYPFQILLSEVLNYLNLHILHEPEKGTDKFYIHLLMCVGGVQGVDTRGKHSAYAELGNSGVGDVTYGMRALSTHPSFGGKKKRKTKKGKKRKIRKSKKRNNKKKKVNLKKT